MDKLSIIIPCYNHGKYLQECLRSVQDNWLSIEREIIVVDDCSTDNSFDVVKSLSSIYNFKFYQTETNSKLSAVRNFGIKKSSGNLIVCLDSDDKLPPNYFQDNYNNILMYGVDVSYNNSLMFGSVNKEINWPEFNIELLKRSPFIHCASMYKKVIWEKSNYDELMITGWEDYDFWLNAAKAGFKFKKCNSTYLYYRQGDSNFSQVHIGPNDKLEKIKKYLRNKHFGFYLG